jgi:hypothetical protein
VTGVRAIIVSVCLETVLESVKDRRTDWTKCTIGSKIVLTHPIVLLGDEAHVVSVHLETVLVSVQDRCAVCAKHTIGSEMILDAPNGAPR